MVLRLILILIICNCFSTVPANPKKSSGPSNIYIESETLDIKTKDMTLEFCKKVSIAFEKHTLFTEKIIVYNKLAGNKSIIEKILIPQTFKLISNKDANNFISGDKALYNALSKTLTVEGNVRAYTNHNTVITEKLVIKIK